MNPPPCRSETKMLRRMTVRTLAAALVAAILLSPSLFSQVELESGNPPDGPTFFIDALSFIGGESGSGRLDMYIEVPYETIQFIKENELFVATYDVSIEIFDSADQRMAEKSWTERVETRQFGESISPTIGNLSQRTFALAPAAYTVTVQVRDNETRKTVKQSRKIVVRGYGGKPFALSDLLLVNRSTVENGKRIVYPNVTGNVGEVKDAFYVYFEVYDSSACDSVNLMILVRNAKGDVVQRDSVWQRLGEYRTPCVQRVGSAGLFTGDYRLEVEAVLLQGKDGSAIQPEGGRSSRNFIVRWRGMPASVVDLDRAVDQMVYLAGQEELDSMKDADAETRKELFRTFWKKRDPTPNSIRNELMEEYFSRVEYSNKHFSHYLDGWRTDMGMVYIIFGPPSNIDRHPFDIDVKPYEIWTYYQVNREFVFVDATGFGDYRLQTPIWDVWRTRPR